MSTTDYAGYEDAARGGYGIASVGSNASIDLEHDLGLHNHDSLKPRPMVLPKAEALAYCHPDYMENAAKWSKYRALYEGRDVYRFIHRHIRESDVSYQLRVKRGYFYDYCESIVDLMVDYIYCSSIIRKHDGGELFDEIYRNADLRGTSYQDFMQQAATSAQVDGHVGILADAPPMGGGVMSERQRRESGKRPYLALYSASQIRDWDCDEFGRFRWVKLCMPSNADRPFTTTVGSNDREYLIYTRARWDRYRVSKGIGNEDKVTYLGGGEHTLGKVPLVILRNKKHLSHEWFGLSALRYIADINIALMNWASFGDEEIANRCLNILVAKRDENDKGLEISQYNVLEHDAETEAGVPRYLVPGETPLKMIREWIMMARDEIYRLAKMGGSTGLLGVREATSGVAYAYEFNETNQALAGKAAALEKGEIEIHQLLAEWTGAAFDGEIMYPREFGVDDFLTELSIMFQARESLTSETALRELEKRLTRKMFAKKPASFLDKINAEIDREEPKPMTALGQGLDMPLGDFQSKDRSTDTRKGGAR